ncbi:MAG: galactokinase [Verrucomicrobia bacterium]|nr:galactokinase [Verrucomicrobiota bacterium]
MTDLKNFFKQHFGSWPVHRVQAPGRLELLGNHTDYNRGLVLSLAVDRNLEMASAPRKDGKIELVSSAFPEKERFACDRIEKNDSAAWAGYVKGVLLQLRQRRVNFTGFNAAIRSTVPLGAGMSSSAALEVATALTIRRLFPFTLSPGGIATPPKRNSRGELPPLSKPEKLALAGVCRNAESEFVGVNCGLLDQISCLFGKASHLIEIDCQHLTVEHLPLPPGVGVIVCDSGVKHELADGAYNALRRECESAARALGAASLRAVDAARLQANKTRLTEREYQCAYHVIGENHRVVCAGRALWDGDLAQLGEYLFESHASSRDFFKNSCPELDLLVDLARAQPGCLGARLSGGGFGGATINLVRESEAERFSQEIATKYEEQTGRKLSPSRCRLVDGAG